MELRDQLKAWERAFYEEHGRKSVSSDAKKDPEIYKLYKQYWALKSGKTNKATQEALAPKDVRDHSQSLSNSKEFPPLTNEDAIESADDELPSKQLVSEVFPTPQVNGRVLGIFDIKLPETPSKAPKTPQTPLKTHILSTPMSQRTPQYVNERVTLFPNPSESPLFPQKKRKSIGQLIQENESFISSRLDVAQVQEDESTAGSSDESEPELSNDLFGERAKYIGIREVRKDGEPDDSEQQPQQRTEDTDPDRLPMSVPLDPSDKKYQRRRTNKRQTRSVVMRPVLDTDVVSKKKATDNYQRLKIQKGRRPPGRH